MIMRTHGFSRQEPQVQVEPCFLRAGKVVGVGDTTELRHGHIGAK